MSKYANKRGIHAFLRTIFAEINWNVAVEHRFETFYNEQLTPGKPFEADALLKNLPSSQYLTNPRNKDIFYRFWGLGREAETLQKIADDYDISRERFRQIKEKGVRIMKHPSRKDLIRNNLEEMGFFF